MRTRGSVTLENPVEIGVPLSIEGPVFESLLEWSPRPGEAVTVSGPGGTLLRARVTELGEGRACLLPFELMGRPPAWPAIILLQALPERGRMETIIQKTTELGVSAVVPFKSEKSISLQELDGRQRRSHNWATVALKAAKQSRRPDIPDVAACSSFHGALEAARGCGLRLVLWEGAQRGMREALGEAKRPVEGAALLVGPEGGLTGIEVRAALDEGFEAVNLGPRVLRTETAAIFGVGVLGYELSG